MEMRQLTPLDLLHGEVEDRQEDIDDLVGDEQPTQHRARPWGGRLTPTPLSPKPRQFGRIVEGTTLQPRSDPGDASWTAESESVYVKPDLVARMLSCSSLRLLERQILPNPRKLGSLVPISVPG